MELEGQLLYKNYKNLRDIDHQQHPFQRVEKPENVARACLFLTGAENDFINGENIIIDGGMTKKMIYEE
ncbi:Enoyl-(Acyl carrier protein) reductase [Anaerovirgula multivorans]|uniref:Enoyl-(Acyl carrier protein) reductase n=1 Tax=Anaerovirgula multivorans TaxID=312168 RepID=A0A239JC62_9FIRM|nr:SDR family oxidoreductase [Anaerovirgula multivorans]SNT03501.1 Enoyl-(Acyl carrier protein) reductase [Anaerovirgula multivorans]